MRCLAALRNTFSTIQHIRGSTLLIIKNPSTSNHRMCAWEESKSNPLCRTVPISYSSLRLLMRWRAGSISSLILTTRSVSVDLDCTATKRLHSVPPKLWQLRPQCQLRLGRHGQYKFTHSDDVARFMYEHKISMATLGGHGLGAKIALAAACHHYEKTTGYFSIDSSPMEQRYHEPYT